ncbi:MAG: tetratricopeptide repeat protein [Deltaproteobacteria bacterium]|nr:tetratricopeptide repeat protein [Deltaproteobacteria bacterium]
MHAPNSEVAKRRWFAGAATDRQEEFVWRAPVRRGRSIYVVLGCRFGLYVAMIFCAIALLATIARLDLGAQARTDSRLLAEHDQTLETRSYQRRAVALLQNNFGEEELGVADGLIDLAGVSQRQKRYAEAETLHDRALIIFMHHLGSDDPRVMDTLDRLAGLHLEQGNSAMAGAVLQFAHSIREQAKSE